MLLNDTILYKLTTLPPSAAVTCPAGTTGTVPGTSGTGGTSGCTFGSVPGYSGTGVIATTESPFYTTDVAGRSIRCESSMR